MKKTTSTYHPQLSKQLETLNKKFVNDAAFISFLKEVNETYNSLESDKQQSEKASKLAEQEYKQVTKNLQLEIDLRKESIQKLKDTISLFDNEVKFEAEKQEDNISNMFSYLKKHIQKSILLETRLRKAKEDAESASLAKGDFLSVMSHEIRTPLNAINGIIHLLSIDNPAPHQLENLKALDVSAENLLSLINDILDFSKIENGKIVFNKRHFELRSFLENIKLTYNHCANDKGNTIDIKVDERISSYIKGDDLRLRQILNNLVSNAIKFTKDGTITIETELVDETTDALSLRFSVKDTGIGIQKHKQQHIFERFAQADASTTREYGGTGLGLAITKKLLELQGSRICLESAVGKGSEFHFELKFDKGDLKSERIFESKALCNLQGARILLVDDNSMNILFTKKLIHQWNTEVDTATNGVEAIEKVEGQDYDLILMDLHMPVMDGYTASEKIRTFNKEIPIIALTASIDSDVQEKIQKYGMNNFSLKPFKPNELYELICQYIDYKTPLLN